MNTKTEDRVPAMLDVRGVAKLMDCSVRTIYRLSDSGHMPPPLKVGRLVRFRRSDIEPWIADGCRPVRTSRGVR